MKLTVIQNKIYEIRGHKIMHDFDLAELYDVETRVLNQAMKRNLESFPEDFMFRLTNVEWTNLKSQIVISNSGGIENQSNDSSQIVISGWGGTGNYPMHSLNMKSPC